MHGYFFGTWEACATPLVISLEPLFAPGLSVIRCAFNKIAYCSIYYTSSIHLQIKFIEDNAYSSRNPNLYLLFFLLYIQGRITDRLSKISARTKSFNWIENWANISLAYIIITCLILFLVPLYFLYRLQRLGKDNSPNEQ